jgi:methionyl-tRNA formyltransferase
MGTPTFAVPALEALLAAGHEIAAVYTRPPRPAGRGQRPQASPVERLARANAIPVLSPTGLRTPEAAAEFAAFAADAGVVVAYGRILPDAFLEAPRLGFLNLHASLLPRWRGAAPIQRAVMAGDAETGVSAMLVTPALDSGDILLQARLPIGPTTTAGDLHDELARLGAPLLCEALAGYAAGTLEPRPQGEAGVTYAEKLDKAEARIDWSLPAARLACLVNGLSPLPGAWFEVRGERIKALRAKAEAGSAAAGTVQDNHGLLVGCGKGRLRLIELQRAGRAALDADALRRGLRLEPGQRLG